MKHTVLRFTFYVLLLALFPTIVHAQDGDISKITADDVNEVARGMFCPTCESTPLDVCPTQTCQDWRQLIRQQIADGMTTEEIHLYFADNYGDHVLAVPPRRGFDLMFWVLPIIGIFIGGIMVYRHLRSLQQASEPIPELPESDAPTLASDDYVARIEQELQNRYE